MSRKESTAAVLENVQLNDAAPKSGEPLPTPEPLRITDRVLYVVADGVRADAFITRVHMPHDQKSYLDMITYDGKVGTPRMAIPHGFEPGEWHRDGETAPPPPPPRLYVTPKGRPYPKVGEKVVFLEQVGDGVNGDGMITSRPVDLVVVTIRDDGTLDLGYPHGPPALPRSDAPRGYVVPPITGLPKVSRASAIYDSSGEPERWMFHDEVKNPLPSWVRFTFYHIRTCNRCRRTGRLGVTVDLATDFYFGEHWPGAVHTLCPICVKSLASWLKNEPCSSFVTN